MSIVLKESLVGRRWLLGVTAVVLLAGCAKKESPAQTTATGATSEEKLLNVSYDPTRELYAAFAKSWKARTGHVNTPLMSELAG